MKAISAPEEGRPRLSQSLRLEREPERGRFRAVASQEDVSCHRRVVPCLALDTRIPGDLLELTGVAETVTSSPRSESISNTSWSDSSNSWPWPYRPPFHFLLPSSRSMQARMLPSNPKAWPSCTTKSLK